MSQGHDVGSSQTDLHPAVERPGTSVPTTQTEDAGVVLKLSGIVKRWDSRQPPVLDGIELELERGSALGVRGRNGAGKTTLLRVIAGLLKPESGVARLLGFDPERDATEYKRRLGLLAAGNSGLYARLNVDQNLELWARLALMRRPQRIAAIAEMSDRFDLHPLRGRRVDRLSMGQRQRLRLALAFLHNPDLVLLDEPCTSLDDQGVAHVRTALERLRARGGAAIVCSPDSEGERLRLDRAAVIVDGRLLGPDCRD